MLFIRRFYVQVCTALYIFSSTPPLRRTTDDHRKTRKELKDTRENTIRRNERRKGLEDREKGRGRKVTTMEDEGGVRDGWSLFDDGCCDRRSSPRTRRVSRYAYRTHFVVRTSRQNRAIYRMRFDVVETSARMSSTPPSTEVGWDAGTRDEDGGRRRGVGVEYRGHKIPPSPPHHRQVDDR